MSQSSSVSSSLVAGTRSGRPYSSEELKRIASEIPSSSAQPSSAMDCLVATAAAAATLEDDLSVSNCSDVFDTTFPKNPTSPAASLNATDESSNGNQVLSQVNHSCILQRDEPQSLTLMDQVEVVTPVKNCDQIFRDGENSVVEGISNLKLCSQVDSTNESIVEIADNVATSSSFGCDITPPKIAMKRSSTRKASLRSKAARKDSKCIKQDEAGNVKSEQNKKDIISVDEEIQPVCGRVNKLQCGKTSMVAMTRASRNRKCPVARSARKPEQSARLKARSTRVRTSRSNIPGKSRYWTPLEHQLFIHALVKFGPKNLKLISAHVKTRNTTQCRTHEQKCFMRLMRWAMRDTIMREAIRKDMSSDDLIVKLSKVQKDLYSVPPECGLSLLFAVAEETTDRMSD